MGTTFKIKWSHGHTESGFKTYDDALAAVRAVLTDPVIGHDGDISEGGERTLFWADEERAADDDGARSAGEILAVHTPLPAEGWYRTQFWTRGHRGWYLADIDGRGEGAVLYTPAEWDACDAGDFGVDAQGRITFQGQPTGRTLDQLTPCTEAEARQAEVG